MKLTTVSAASAVSVGTLGLAGLVTAGVLAFPATASSGSSADDRFVKRDDDTPDVVLVADDDDDDTNARDDTNTNTNTQGQTRTRTNDNTGTGVQTGRDNSRDRLVRDLTNDGPGADNRDFSARHTNDRSRHNTRR